MDKFDLKKYLAEGRLEQPNTVYVVIPFYSNGVDIFENDVMTFKNFDAAQEYSDGLEGSPMIIETDLK